MKDKKTGGYISGAIVLIVGLLVAVVGFEQGLASGKYSIIIGFFMMLIGGGSLKFPETVGHATATWLKGLVEEEKPRRRYYKKTYNKNKTNIRARHSNYTGSAKTVYNITNINSDPRSKRRSRKRK